MLNKMIVAAMPLVPKPIVKIIAKSYIAGPKLDDAVRVTQDLMKQGGMSTVDVLGEFVEDRARATHEKDESSLVLDAVSKNNLKTYLSIKPTSLGLGIDWDFGYGNISELAAKAKDLGIFMRLDMENSPYTDDTIKAYKKLREDGFDNVGTVFQAYMKRTEADIKSLIDYKPNLRLCKGIYVEDASIAYKDKEEIRDNYKMLLELMLDNGMYSGIATHDEPLIQFGEEQVKKRNLKKDQYEFQMLLGVREERRGKLLKAGYPLRVYVPFGEDWYGYATRRVKENPQMAGHIVKSILGLNK
jgi:proline dehydrogenase